MKLVDDDDVLVWHAAASLGMGTDEDGRGEKEEDDILPGRELLCDGEGNEEGTVVVVVIISIIILRMAAAAAFIHSADIFFAIH